MLVLLALILPWGLNWLKLSFRQNSGFHLSPGFSGSSGFFRALVYCLSIPAFFETGFLLDPRIFRFWQTFLVCTKILNFVISPVSNFPRNMCSSGFSRILRFSKIPFWTRVSRFVRSVLSLINACGTFAQMSIWTDLKPFRSHFDFIYSLAYCSGN